jgi:predicted DNA-binding transcriptional regulator AlpA
MMTRWLSLPHAAEHLDISADQLRRFVREGKLPAPDRSLGVRMPRWDREALDNAMRSVPPVPNIRDPDIALQRWLDEQRQNRPRRTANAR